MEHFQGLNSTIGFYNTQIGARPNIDFETIFIGSGWAKIDLQIFYFCIK